MTTSASRIYRPNTYRPDIDGLRAISILLVVLYHGFPQAIPGGFIGVDVFFVISGYLITQQIYGQAKAGSFSFRGFYTRRIRRIFPPLIAVLIFSGVYGYFRLNLNDFTPLFKHIAAGTAFISNFVLWHDAGYFDQESIFKPLLHLWSLAIEEQFYIFWPILVVSLTAASRRYRDVLGWTLLLVCAASLAAGLHLLGHDSVGAFYSPLSRFWELGLGGLLAVLQLDRAAIPRFSWDQQIRNIATAIGCACLVACAFLLTSSDHFPSPLTVLPALAAVTIIAAGPYSIINRRLLASAPMVQVGLISYALYLWHWPLLSFSRIEGSGVISPTVTWLVLATSVALAALTRLLVEKPIRHSPVRNMPVWLTTALVCIGIVGMVGYKTELFWPRRMQLQAQIQNQMKTAWREFNFADIPNSDCAELVATDTPVYHHCHIWGPATAKLTVAVWGDSMAGAWMPPFFALAREQGWRVIQFSHMGCPPIIGVRIINNSRPDIECRVSTLSAQIMETMRRAKPDVVFVIARWNLYYHGFIKNDTLIEPIYIADGPDKPNADSTKKAFARYLPKTINELSKFSRVVVFRDTPLLKVPIDVGISTRPKTFIPSVSEMQNFEIGINDVIDTALTQTSNAVAFDPTKRLCDATKCAAYLDGLPAYFDEVHLLAHATMQYLSDIELLGTSK